MRDEERMSLEKLAIFMDLKQRIILVMWRGLGLRGVEMENNRAR